MNIFTSHPKKQGETYLQHMKFTAAVASRMILSSAFFLTHGFLPFVDIPTVYNLESVIKFLKEKNEKRA